MIRIWDSPFLHVFSFPEIGTPIAVTVCGLRFVYIERDAWPRGADRPPLPRCPECT